MEWRLERTVAASEQDTEGGRERCSDVEVAVTIEVANGKADDRAPGPHRVARRERSVAKSTVVANLGGRRTDESAKHQIADAVAVQISARSEVVTGRARQRYGRRQSKRTIPVVHQAAGRAVSERQQVLPIVVIEVDGKRAERARHR